MTDRVLVDRLVERVFGWHPTPNRFMTRSGERGWITRSAFRPFTEIDHALRLAHKVTRRYSVTADPAGFTAEVQYGDRVGRARAKQMARAVTLAVVDILGLSLQSGVCDCETPKKPARGGK